MSDILREIRRDAARGERTSRRPTTDRRSCPTCGRWVTVGTAFGIEDVDGTITWLCHKCGPRELIRRLDAHAGAA
jgi:hypothetical protein